MSTEQERAPSGVSPGAAAIPKERLLHIHRTMVRLRVFDEKLIELRERREPIIHHPTLGQY